MNNKNIEKLLSGYQIRPASNEYKEKAYKIIHKKRKLEKVLCWNWALASFLILSLMTNLFLLQDTVEGGLSDTQKYAAKYSVEQGVIVRSDRKYNLIVVMEK